MAVVKASYTRRKGAVKAHLRYITHRPGRDNARTTRVLFGRDGRLTKDQAYELIDQARRGTVFFRIMLSPDPRQEDRFEDLNLRELTADALLYLQQRLQTEIHFIAAEHADHRPHRHVHLIALIQGRLTKADIQALRAFVTEAALRERQELDLARQASREATFARTTGTRAAGQKAWRSPTQTQVYPRTRRVYRLRQGLPFAPTCPSCRLGEPMTQLSLSNVYECLRCGLRITRTPVSAPSPSQEAGWGL